MASEKIKLFNIENEGEGSVTLQLRYRLLGQGLNTAFTISFNSVEEREEGVNQIRGQIEEKLFAVDGDCNLYKLTEGNFMDNETLYLFIVQTAHVNLSEFELIEVTY